MKVSFTVEGIPKGKGRPRFAKTAAGVRGFTPHDTMVYENMVAWSYKQECGDIKLKGALVASICAFFPIPKSASKKAREQMEKGKVMYTHKPDADNIAKIILDSLNGIAYDDDRQVVFLNVTKAYGSVPRAMVEIREL